MIGELPTTIKVGGVDMAIRSDYRDILKILCAYSDPTLDDVDKAYVCLFIIYKDFEQIPDDAFQEAYEKATVFIDCGRLSADKKPSPKVLDWEQDESILFPAANKAAGFEVRSVEYLHWWTFMGYYMEISEGVFSQVVSIRTKRSKHKKLEKWEQEFYKSNKEMCDLKPRLTEEEKAKKERLRKMLDGD